MNSNVIPNKSLGQHWLEDERFLQSIANQAELNDSDTVVEIGPGLGTLTRHLVKKAKKVVALELDQKLANGLTDIVKSDNLSVVNQDCLTYDYNSLPQGYKVVANIPYYLTSNLLQILSENSNPPEIIVLLIQKEVAQRVAASAGNMSILSISVQLYYKPELGDIVPASYFTPPPKIDSQIIKLTRLNKPLIERKESKHLFRVVKAGFSQKRKKLRSSLSSGLHISKEEAKTLMNSVGIDENKRPQDLSISQWLDLSKIVKQ